MLTLNPRKVKIKMEFIDNKLRRYTTFSKRKTGIMKKVRDKICWELNSQRLEYAYCRINSAKIHVEDQHIMSVKRHRQSVNLKM